ERAQAAVCPAVDRDACRDRPRRHHAWRRDRGSPMTVAPVHLLAVHDLTRDEILSIFREAAALKAMRRRALATQRLSGQTLGLFFEKPSTRTRVSFETGMNQLGGQSLFLSVADIQMRRGETVADTARVLSRYLDGLVIRAYEAHAVEGRARHAPIPVHTGLPALHHPSRVPSYLVHAR